MSDPMAVTIKVEENQINGDQKADASAASDPGPSLEPTSQPLSDQLEESAPQATEIKVEEDDTIVKTEEQVERPYKRRASAAFSDEGDPEEFRGFDGIKPDNPTDEYSRVLERINAEVTVLSENFTPVRSVVATPSVQGRVNKRLRQDTGTDNSRPSSAMSSRSEGDGIVSSTDPVTPPSFVPPVSVAVPSSAASSPAYRSGRRATTTEMSSPLLRIPLERGWKRELVYRAALDAHSRRNADIYYYTPNGKKLRSTREVGEHLSGTGLTLENFSFFKEPLGVDDPEKEIIRDAKLNRRVESPVTSAAAQAPVEGKRTPKPKQPKGASPDHTPNVSPPLKIKVKLSGSRLSTGTGSPAAPAKPAPAKKAATPATPAPSTDNNNTTNWKKPSVAGADRLLPGPPAPGDRAGTPGDRNQPPGDRNTPAGERQAAGDKERVPPPPPLRSRPPEPPPPVPVPQSPPQIQQPCSISCGGGAVPSLACSACLCLYHEACVQHRPPAPFLCKNCKKSTSPPLEPPPLLHKSGVSGARGPAPPRRPVLLTMKVSGSDAGGQRVWSVSRPAAAPGPAAARALLLRPTLPQSLAVFKGKRFIVVPRSMAAPKHDAKPKGRLSNGAAPAAISSPRRRGRGKVDDTDYFTDFCNKSKAQNYNCVIQIFQYLGMRDLAHCARVCKLWRELAATPALWRHVRMKNSHVSDWSGLCSALKKHGTSRLDLRKMLLPQNDTAFWEAFAQHLPTVDTLERIELCRCPASAVEAVCRGMPNLRSLSALAVRDARLDPTPLACLPRLTELRLKSMAGLSLARDLTPLAQLTRLHHLSLTSIKDLGCCSCEVVGTLKQLVSLELGECTFRASFGAVLAALPRLQRLRLERGTAECAAPALLRALATLPRLHQLELVNFDVKVGFDDALAECKNIQRLLIIPTYVSQSATTNKQVLSGVLRLKDTLTHLMWGVTIELLRVTELFIDQCDQGGDSKKKDIGECIPVLKPVPGCRLPEEHHHVAGPPQVEILPLPTLQRLLSAQLPSTKLKLLRIPFHATWRQSLADFQ